MSLNAAILFEPDAYLLSEPKLMGRQAAGNSFLRAAVAGSQGHLYAYTPHERSANVFKQLVQTIDPSTTGHWIPADQLELLQQRGTLYLPGPGLDEASKLRLRVGSAAYSLVGVTHTTASHRAMDAITNLLAAPVMPWDALICTSTAVLDTVKVLLNAQIETLRWRFGSQIQITLPQFPVIPLGVHCRDFDFTPEQRTQARALLNISDDECVLVFVGRLSFHAKAHPHIMYLAAQAVAEKTGKKITLLQCGWFGNDAIKASFVDGASVFCPDVRAIFVDGRQSEMSRSSWAGADIFISLSDNVQETFGITPIEAMASGLPVVVSDWNGYKDTVRDGIDGFRIPTWMPPPNLGENFAKTHEAGTVNYDIYCGLTCQTIAVSLPVLVEKLMLLVNDASLRQKMGDAGKAHAKAAFDWHVVYGKYQALYAELQSIRHSIQHNTTWQQQLQGAPTVSTARLDPYLTFKHYPTNLYQPQTAVNWRAGTTTMTYRELAKHPLFNYAGQVLPSQDVVDKIALVLHSNTLTIEEIAQQTQLNLGITVLAIAVLAKMAIIDIH